MVRQTWIQTKPGHPVYLLTLRQRGRPPDSCPDPLTHFCWVGRCTHGSNLQPSIFPATSPPLLSPFLVTHQHRWHGWRLLHSAQRTPGLSSPPWWPRVPPRYHTVSRWACPPHSARTRASVGCASPHHWGPHRWVLLPDPQNYSQVLWWGCCLRLRFPSAHQCLMQPQPEAEVIGGWMAGPWILKGSLEWLISHHPYIFHNLSNPYQPSHPPSETPPNTDKDLHIFLAVQ